MAKTPSPPPSSPLGNWADRCHQVVDESGRSGPHHPGAGMLALVHHAASPLHHISWFYGKNKHEAAQAKDTGNATMNGLAPEKYFHFKVFDRRTGALVAERVSLITKLGMEFLFEDLRRVNSFAFIKKILKRETERMGEASNQPQSASHISGFIKEFNLPLDDLLEPDISKYQTFNEFFSRKLRPGARPLASPENPAVISSAADCRLSVFPTVAESKRLWIKGAHFTIQNLVQDEKLAEVFTDGSLGIFRLAPQDYHRWHCPIGGQLQNVKYIDGTYYTVNPKAVKENLDVYTENARRVLTIQNPIFGTVALVAVGALMVGSISITAPDGLVERGQEMGYFTFGGSTCIVLFQKGRMQWDDDLLEHSDSGIETLVRVGERVGAAVTADT